MKKDKSACAKRLSVRSHSFQVEVHRRQNGFRCFRTGSAYGFRPTAFYNIENTSNLYFRDSILLFTRPQALHTADVPAAHG